MLARLAALILLTLALALAATGLAQQPAGDGKSMKRQSLADLQGERRVALVIGNGDYKHASPLSAPPRDAVAVQAKLRALGFQVIPCQNERGREIPCIDLSYEQMGRAVRAFGEALSAGGVGLFYYSGHGLQVDGKNWLVPVNADLSGPQDVRYRTLAVGEVLGAMERAQNRLNLVVLDACRDNPFKGFSKSYVGGLAGMQAPTGTLLAYATAPGQVARDGRPDSLSPYTATLLQHIDEPGVPIESVLKRVRADLVGQGQVPWESSSIIGEFYFALPEGRGVAGELPKSGVQAQLDQLAKITAVKARASKEWAEIAAMREGAELETKKRMIGAFLSQYDSYTILDGEDKLPVEIAELSEARALLERYGEGLAGEQPGGTLGAHIPPTLSQRPDPVRVVAEPAALVLGRDGAARIRFERASGDPLDDLLVRASSGELELKQEPGATLRTANYTPQSVQFPHLALITAVSQSDPEHTYGALALPLLGNARFPVTATPGASVTVTVGGQEFGPVLADASGRVAVPLVVPPGVSQARLSFGGAGVPTALDLKIPPTARIALFPLAIYDCYPDHSGWCLSVRAFVVTPSGQPDPSATVDLAVDSPYGEPTTRVVAPSSGDGIYTYIARFESQGPVVRGVRVTASIRGEGAVQTVSLEQ